MVGVWGIISVKFNQRAVKLNLRHSLQIKLDTYIPFCPLFVYLYFSAYPLCILGFYAFIGTPQLLSVGLGYLFLFIAAVLCYWLFPYPVPRRELLTANTPAKRLLIWFQQKSPPYNSFPSMHVGYTLFSALTIHQWHSSNMIGYACLIWAGGVALATLVTKQHVLLDVCAGAILSGLAFWLIS